MKIIVDNYYNKLENTSLEFQRSGLSFINWDSRMIGIKGARGVGKTTLLLQHIKLSLPPEQTLYVSLDNIWFTENKLYDLADYFSKHGGKYLLLDEVHKYPNWSQELKNIYDDFPPLKVVFTSSSLLQILNARADLSRRAVMYQMQGLSFREYLNFVQKENFPIITLQDILENHAALSRQIVQKIKPLQYFDDYLQTGYYPFFKENASVYHQLIGEIVNMIIEVELPLLRGLETRYITKVKQLLYIISTSVPFIPNVSKLSERIGISRETLLAYLHHLSEAHLTKHLFKNAEGITLLQKPNKIFIENTNLMYALAAENINEGNLRETFFLNQVDAVHKITYPESGDFLVDKKWLFEIGGKTKTRKQLKNIPAANAYIAMDNVEYGYSNNIPLWLFGFLY